MAAIKVKTAKRVIPMIYAYTTPEIKRHDGWTKIGYTEQDVDKRLNQQTHTADVEHPNTTIDTAASGLQSNQTEAQRSGFGLERRSDGMSER